MADWFVLRLDTRAPEVTWGAASEVGAGELFTVEFELDEPAPIQAWLIDAGGQRAELDIFDGTLEAVLPPDFYGGWATVHLVVADDVLNQADRTTRVLLTGHAPPQADRPSAGPPIAGRPPRPEIIRRTVSTRSAALASSSTDIRVSTLETGQHGRARSRTTITVAPGRRGRYLPTLEGPFQWGPSRAVARSNVANIATTVAGSPADGMGRSTTTIERRDGPDEEAAAMILLGI